MIPYASSRLLRILPIVLDRVHDRHVDFWSSSQAPDEIQMVEIGHKVVSDQIPDQWNGGFDVLLIRQPVFLAPVQGGRSHHGTNVVLGWRLLTVMFRVIVSATPIELFEFATFDHLTEMGDILDAGARRAMGDKDGHTSLKVRRSSYEWPTGRSVVHLPSSADEYRVQQP